MGTEGAWVAGSPLLTPCRLLAGSQTPSHWGQEGGSDFLPGTDLGSPRCSHSGEAASQAPHRLRPAGLDAEATAGVPALRPLSSRTVPGAAGIARSRVSGGCCAGGMCPPCGWDLRCQRPRRAPAAGGQRLPGSPAPWPCGAAARLSVPRGLGEAHGTKRGRGPPEPCGSE